MHCFSSHSFGRMPVSEHAAAFIDNARKRAAKLLRKQKKWRGDLTYQGIPLSTILEVTEGWKVTKKSRYGNVFRNNPL